MWAALLGSVGLPALAKAGTLGASMAAMNPALLAGLGSGLGAFLQTGDLKKGLQSGIGGYLGGTAAGALGNAFGDPRKAGAASSALTGSAGNSLGASYPPHPRRLAGSTTGTGTVGSGQLITPPTLGSSLMNTLQSPAGLGALAGTAMASTPPKVEKEEMPEPIEGMPPELMLNKPPEGYRAGYDPEYDYMFPTNFRQGGIMGLQEGGMMPEEMMMDAPPLPEMPETMMDIPPPPPAMPENMMAPSQEMPNEKEIINNAVSAIKGESPNPEIALGLFLQTFGEEALRDLVQRVEAGEFDMNAQVTEGLLSGAGDGMDDMIPATLEGEQDVVLSEGEFIVPADVVSGIGNGSTDAGSNRLYDMMDRVRMMRGGTVRQAPDIPAGMMLPV